MADLLNQDEIDALLNSGTTDDASEAADPAEDGDGVKSGGRAKKFYHEEHKNDRFRFRYHSPVVKQSRFLWNPDPTSSVPRDTMVVRSLDNYIAYQRNRRLAAQ